MLFVPHLLTFTFCQDIGDDSNDTDYTPGGPVAADDYPAKRVTSISKHTLLTLARKEMMPSQYIFILSFVLSSPLAPFSLWS